MNRLRLRATLMAMSELRYTPAGIPVLNVKLQHDGPVVEAGIERRLDVEVEAVVLGEAAGRLARTKLGQRIDIDGFIAPRTRRSRTLIVHINEFEISPEH